MFKKTILLAVATLMVGCSAHSIKSGDGVKSTHYNSLQNYNIVRDYDTTVNGQKVTFIAFAKREDNPSNQRSLRVSSLDTSGSGIQWNEDYVVTAKHVDFVENSAYKCGDECEIQFVKRKAKGPVPVWREVVTNERMTFVGVDVSLKTRADVGSDIDYAVYTSSNRASLSRLATNKTVGGMSGGPAYGDDGKVIGMLTGGVTNVQVDGHRDKKLEGKGDDFSAYLPYSTIKAEWDKFQATQH